MYRRIIFLAFLFFLLHTISFSQTREDNARYLIKLTGADAVAVQLMNTIFPKIKELAPQVPEAFWQKVSERINLEELVDLVIPIYLKHYTDQEILQLIDFYKSPLGQKVIKELPSITQESYTIGQAWGEKMVDDIFSQLEDAGYKI